MRGLLFHAAGNLQEAFYSQVIFPALESFPILGKIATVGVTVCMTCVNGERSIGSYNAIKTDGRILKAVGQITTI